MMVEDQVQLGLYHLGSIADFFGMRKALLQKGGLRRDFPFPFQV
jgi:hypothetical protein